MIFTIILCISACQATVYCLQDTGLTHNVTQRNFVYNTYEYDTIINLLVNNETEQIMDFYEESDRWHGHPTRVHISTNSTINTDYPLFITATQQKGVSSWELPLAVGRGQSAAQFDDMARTLCPHDARPAPNITSVNRPVIHLSTSSATNVSVNIKLRRVQDFYIELDKEVHLNVTPSTPKYYYFSFDSNPWNRTRDLLPKFNYTIPKSVIVILESDDDLCAIVSIQNNSCPVFDNEHDVAYQGYHLTMTTKGGVTLTQSMFPEGFYVVMMVKLNDDACRGDEGPAAGGDPLHARMKTFRMRVIATISYAEYLVGALVLLALVLLVALLTLVALVPCSRCHCSEEAVGTVTVTETDREAGPSTSRDDEAEPIVRPDTDTDSLSDSESDRFRDLPPLTVAGLSRAKPKAQNRRSDRYFWSALTVAVVYALPVIQLLSTYQHMVMQTGEQDLCYYNFLCAHPLGPLADFNHVYSNLGYVVLGVVFMLQARARARTHTDQELGIPQHYGLLQSMGLALAMEGLLSACYHLCPNKMNFQFDSSFMYVIAVLVMVKLYQSRHADVNASAHATFLVLAFIMALGLIGIMYPSLYFWWAFTVTHLTACLLLTGNIYYVGRVELDGGLVRRAWRAVRGPRALRGLRGLRGLRPAYPGRAALLALANLANWALAGYGLYEHKKDFARHLLAILMGNAILYTIFYVAMKLIHRERIPPYTWLYGILAHAAWFLALRLFLDSKTKWSESPAGSRRHNAACSSLQLYDSHDLWHATSAAALYLSFNVLLTVDDALTDTPRDLIPVF